MTAKLVPAAVKERLETKKEKVCFVDVRSEDEFRSGHVPGAVCYPLDKIESGEVSVPKEGLVILGCQSGKRSARAREVLRARGYENLLELEGGFSAWAGAGLPVNRLTRAIPVMRQVMLVAGALVLSGTLLGIFVQPWFLAVPAFVGAGLSFAGATGWCGMAFLLERMPWNRPAGACR